MTSVAGPVPKSSRPHGNQGRSIAHGNRACLEERRQKDGRRNTPPPDANLRRYPLSALRTGPCLLPSEDAGRPNRLVDLRLEGEMTRPLATPKLPRKRPRVRGWMRRDRSLCLRHLSSDTLNQDAGKAGNNDATSLHRMEATRPNLSTRVPNWGVPVSVWQHEQCFYGWTQF
jgi:hypothetical protein